MAFNKRSFVFYAEYEESFEELTDEEAGKLIKHILRYVNDRNPNCDDKIIRQAFIPIKQQLKRDLIAWESIKSKRSEAGKASAESKKLAKQELTKSTHVESVELKTTKSTVNEDEDEDEDEDVILLEKETKGIKHKVFNFKQGLLDYGFKSEYVDDWLKVRKTKRGSNTETAMKGFIKQVELCNIDKNEVLRICVEKNWVGLESEWINKLVPIKNTQVNGQPSWKLKSPIS